MTPDLKMPEQRVSVAPKQVKRHPGELDKGSASHALAVNGMQLVLTYWTPEDALSWTPASQGAINVSAQVQGVDSRRIARLTRFKLVVPARAGSEDTVLVNDTGQFVIGAPYSYGSAFTLPHYPAGTKQARVRAYIDLEIETKPKSGQYTRQSLIDMLRVSTIPVPFNQRDTKEQDARTTQ